MAEPDEDVLIARQQGGVRLLTLNRPRVLNALDGGLLARFEGELERISSSADVRAVVVSGAGERAFSVGADLDELASLSPFEARALLSRGQSVFRALETLGVPVIAAVNGYALGGGFELALACSLVVASEDASFGLPEVSLGLIPGYGGTQRLPRLVGAKSALRLLLTGERIDARRAHELGILAEPPVAKGELLEVAVALADRIAANSPIATSLILDAVDRAGRLEPDLAYETALAALATSTPDAAEGIRAFREKRPARFPSAPESAGE